MLLFLYSGQYIFSTGNNNAISTESIDLIYRQAKSHYGADYRLAYQMVDSAYLLSVQANYAEGVLEALITKAEIHRFLGERDSLIYYLEKANHFISENNLRQSLSRVYFMKGSLFDDDGVFDSATVAYFKALDFAEQNSDTGIITNTLNSLALMTANLGDYSKAIAYYKSILVLRVHKATSTSKGTIYFNIGYTYQLKGVIDSALMYYDTAQVIYREDNHISGQAGIYNNLSHFYKNNGDLPKALSYQREALRLDLIVGTPYYVTIDYFNLGSLYNKFDSIDKAIFYYEKGINLAKEKKYERLLANMMRNVSYLHKKKNQYPQAFDYMSKSMFLKDSINSSEMKTKLNEADLRHKAEVEKRKSEYLQYQNLLNKQLIERQRWIVLLSILFAMVLTVLLILNVKNKRKIRRLNTELTANNCELKELNDNKNKYLGVISHDLRAPLANIKGFLAILAESEQNLNENPYFEIVKREVDNTHSLLEDLLCWSQIQFNRQTINPVMFSVSMLLADVVNPLQSIAQKKEVVIKNDIADGLRVCFDENMFKTVMRNLLTNAIKFSFPGGEILITAEPSHPGEVTITVSDKGVGIQPQRIPGIFDPTKSYSTPGTANEKGTGLGLVLCKEFVQLNDGNINIESEPGKGTNVILNIPVMCNR